MKERIHSPQQITTGRLKAEPIQLVSGNGHFWLCAWREGAEIHWGDETALVNTDVRARSYAPGGKTPVVHTVGGTRHKLSMIATVAPQGKARWMIIEDAFDADKLIEFLAALIKDADRKVFLILDNLRVHHSRPVKAWVADRIDQIKLF